MTALEEADTARDETRTALDWVEREETYQQAWEEAHAES